MSLDRIAQTELHVKIERIVAVCRFHITAIVELVSHARLGVDAHLPGDVQLYAGSGIY